MLGRTHATTGALLGMAVLPVLDRVGADVSDPLTIVTFGVVCAGAAVLPDIDHPDGTIAYTIPPITRPIAIAVNRAFGHRKGTHTIFGALVFTAIAVLINLLPTLLGFAYPSWGEMAGRGVLGAWIGLLFAMGVSSLRISPSRSKTLTAVVGLLGGVALAVATTMIDFAVGVIPVAVAVGVLAHTLLGDCWTTQGVRFLAPVSRVNFRFAGVVTGSMVERILIGPMLGFVAILLLLYRLDVLSLAFLPSLDIFR